MTVEERVQAGALFLDINVPGWRDKIDIEKLRIESCLDCILGQIFGNYMEGIHKLNLNSDIDEEVTLGFDSCMYYPFSKEDLTKAWKKYLTTPQPQPQNFPKKKLVTA